MTTLRHTDTALDLPLCPSSLTTGPAADGCVNSYRPCDCGCLGFVRTVYAAGVVAPRAVARMLRRRAALAARGTGETP